MNKKGNNEIGISLKKKKEKWNLVNSCKAVLNVWVMYAFKSAFLYSGSFKNYKQ